MADSVVAIAFVVDSSLALALEWPTLRQFYLTPMLKRLQDTNLNAVFRAAFVIYGTQNTPIVCKNFFFDIQVVLNEAVKCGMGQSSCGGEMGMAALEGFVAAIELFDQFTEDRAKNSPLTSHIFHFSAAIPDDVEHPQCNNSPALDYVTWESLPTELKKRSIHLSSISIKTKLPKFAQLHASASSSIIPPWFITRSQDTVLLAGYTVPQKGVKRAAEPLTPQSPKRPRISAPPIPSPPKPTHSSPPQPSPAPVPVRETAAVAPPPPPPPPPPQNLIPNPTPNPNPVAMAPTPANVNFAQLRELHRVLGTGIAAADAQMKEMRARGEHQQAQLLAQQIMPKRAQFDKLRSMMQSLLLHQQRTAFMQQTAAAQAALQHQQPQLQHQHQSPSQPSLPPPPSSIAESSPSKQEESSDKMAVEPALPVPPPNSHMRSLSGGPNRTLMSNPAAMAQMQKMIEQQERSRQQNTANSGSTAGPRPIWQGPVVWTGTNNLGQPRNIVCHLQASYRHNQSADAKPEMWPKQMMFALPEKPFMPLPELLSRHKPALCVLGPNPSSNMPNNDVAFRTLLTLVGSKNTHFTISWILPGASQPTVNALVYPSPEMNLIGTFFPTTGVPEYPSAEPSIAGPSHHIAAGPPPPVPNPAQPQAPQLQMSQINLTNFRNQIHAFLLQQGMPVPVQFLTQFITPQNMAHLIKLTKEQRSAALLKLARTWQQQQQHRLAAAAAAGRMPGGIPQMGGGGGGPMMPQEGLGFNQFGGNGMSGGFMGSGYPDTITTAPPPQGGGNGAVSFQMMQNFMQRGGDSGGGGM
ncbi:hypothetical protein MIND_00889700 [Mycena indigotica]|uniref:Mediator of RNA polymerase II transcription subunit 25 von Willebrand factor type A domain-containing protein n=1 Tax=Mycena indigotica TaxID=2126181 RepID=A0A8H6W1D4_9AGAR|nr:uncharacterized protein MIND_00889700 [Mycena indigotica]KAF7299401.1 hypothetical protein MIND_00889700 [Mycena indigotica]